MKGTILSGILTIALTVMTVTPILAQGDGHGMKHGDNRAQFIEDLGLSDTQQ